MQRMRLIRQARNPNSSPAARKARRRRLYFDQHKSARYASGPVNRKRLAAVDERDRGVIRPRKRHREIDGRHRRPHIGAAGTTPPLSVLKNASRTLKEACGPPDLSENSPPA